VINRPFQPGGSCHNPFVILRRGEAETGGPSGVREREPVANAVPETCRLSAPLGPPVCAAKARLAEG
jgi:hypothetical protein